MLVFIIFVIGSIVAACLDDGNLAVLRQWLPYIRYDAVQLQLVLEIRVPF